MDYALKLAVVPLIVWLGLVGCMYAAQRSLMYFPARDLPPPPPPFAEVRLRTADGLDLVAWETAPAPGRPIIVYFHGNGGSIAGRVFKVRPFIEAGYGVLLVSWRGYGSNPGSPSEEGLLADGRAALHHVGARAPVVLLGESLGAAVAVRLAAERTPVAAILEAPFASAVAVGAEHYWWLPVRLLMKDRFESIRWIGEVTAPLLILHGERDGVVPVAHGRRLLAAANEPKRGVFLPEAGHNDLFEHGAAGIELEFLSRLRPGGS
jgi:fermentation-respiration switch protein FrsA (DUF1100 family)